MVYGMWERLFVESCPACGGPSSGGFCAVCAAGFVHVADACPRCGLARPVAHCPRLRSAWDVDAVVAPFAYAPPLAHYVQALKYRGTRSLGRAFALLIAPAVARAELRLDSLVPVPLHRARHLERGYNQAHEIARTLGRRLGVAVLQRGVVRRAATAAQAGQGARERRAAMSNAFAVGRDLPGRCVGLVDDVVTTGATANALAAALKAAGAAHCVVLAVARTPEPAQARKV